MHPTLSLLLDTLAGAAFVAVWTVCIGLLCVGFAG
jgi:hypothetical protein